MRESRWRLFWLATLAMAIFQLFRVAEQSLSAFLPSLVHDKPWPIQSLWVFVNFRTLLWVLATPLIALIMVSGWHTAKRLLCHLVIYALFVGACAAMLHQIEHQQKLRRLEVIYGKALVDAGKQMDRSRKQDTPLFRVLAGNLVNELLTGALAYLIIGIVGQAVKMSFLANERMRRSAKLAELLKQAQHQALCDRLQPHFLYNTLNSISALATTDPDSARECITRLSTLLRFSIESLAEQEVDLETEVGILGCYLEIQQIRFGDSLDYQFNIEESALDARVPAFVLQPLVENSFQHGFQTASNQNRVFVSATIDEGHCHLEVRDNGASSNADLPITENDGLGLTRKRLQLIYGNRARMTAERVQPRGFRTSISIPIAPEVTES